MHIEKTSLAIDAIVAVLVLVSIGISLRSCQISGKATNTAIDALEVAEASNYIAQEALQTSSKQFIQINRPYILIIPKRHENNEYRKVSQKANAVEINLKCEVKNVGNVAAKNVHLADSLAARINLKDIPVRFQKPDGIALGPGDGFMVRIQIRMEFDTVSEAKANREFLISDQDDGVSFPFSLNYENELDQSKEYRTFRLIRFKNDRAEIVKSEMTVFTKDDLEKL